ncbi:DNA-binding response regulator, NarL/FixJ family, contains REC and HTH domains [Streptomyces misionensis]|uniref:DNA-binding response regulator, NarL/FixJ family, contains REC and HTH domains n=1 Tax=Streptomyces misionensis TaxID=67331 RepID=A0A1H5HR38_9ACTN|nr:DNA-binding response regulator, NarL/FixJ family, contains REC and HTH domains [Streptomyces misionensis]
MIRAMIVDDALVRLGLADLLDSDPEIDLVAQAADGLQAIERASAHRVDVALVDVRMPRMDGITATARLRALPHPPKVITLTTFDLDQYVYDALAAGADGFLLKDTDPAEILRAVHLVAAGSAMLHPAAARRLIDRYHTGNQPKATAARARLERLTPGSWTFWPCSPRARPTLTLPPASRCGKAPSKPTSAVSSLPWASPTASRPPSWPATRDCPPDQTGRWLGDVVPVAAGERDGERGSVTVDDQVVFRARAGAVDGRGAGVFPPLEGPDVGPDRGAVVQVQRVGAAQLGQQGGVQARPDGCRGPVA